MKLNKKNKMNECRQYQITHNIKLQMILNCRWYQTADDIKLQIISNLLTISNCRWYQTHQQYQIMNNIRLQTISNCTIAFWQLKNHVLYSVHKYQINMRSHILYSVSIQSKYHAVCFNLWCCFLNDRLVETSEDSVLLTVSSLWK